MQVRQLQIVGEPSPLLIVISGEHMECIGLNRKFLRFQRDGVSKPRSFCKDGIEKFVTHWETVIASNGNYVID
jgi:hypothetical protein